MAKAPWARITPALTGLGSLYLASQLARNALGVISDGIEQAFALHATETALLAGVMFLAYGLGQIPAAALLTRHGPRRVLPLAGALLAASFWGFARAEDFSGLLAARLGMGLASAPVLAGAYAVYTGFGEARFTMLAGLQTAFGRAGVVVATTPLAMLVAAVGWRQSFLWAAAGTALAGLAATAVLFAFPRPAAGARNAPGASPLRQLLASPAFRAAALFQGTAAAVSSTILGLWGGPWLSDVYGMEVREQGAMLLGLGLAAFASAPLWGSLARRKAIRGLVPAAAAIACLLLAVPLLVHLPRQAILAWLVTLGLATGFYPAVLDQLRRGLPSGLIIHLSTLLTAGTMLVVFLVQFASGLLADQFPGRPGDHPEAAYGAIFMMMGALLTLTTFGYSRHAARQPEAPSDLTKINPKPGLPG